MAQKLGASQIYIIASWVYTMTQTPGVSQVYTMIQTHQVYPLAQTPRVSQVYNMIQKHQVYTMIQTPGVLLMSRR